MKIFVFLTFVFALLLSVMGHSHSLHVLSQTEVQSETITLGDLLPKDSVDLQTASLVLDDSPKIGKSVTWTSQDVSKKLRKYQNLLNNTQIKVPQMIKITRLDAGMTKEQLKEKILLMLKENLGVNQAHWKVHLTKLQEPQWPEMSEKAQFKVIPLLERPKGSTLFEIVVEEQGKALQHFWLSGEVQYFAPVAVVQKNIKQKSKIEKSDFILEEKNVTYFNDFAADETDFKAGVTKVPLIPGQILTKNQFEKELAFKFGDEVEVNAANESVFINIKAIAQQNGYLGDTVKLRTTPGQKVISGIVTGKGQVNVKF
jgi:flagella basal body P-ring formation protein FlgA